MNYGEFFCMQSDVIREDCWCDVLVTIPTS